MKLLNRFAVLVRPKAPYYAWTGAIDPGAAETLAVLGNRSRDHIYLTDQQEPVDVRGILLACWQQIFADQLAGWHREQALWPKGRTYLMFRQWFSVEVLEMVADLSEEPLQAD